MVEKYQPSGGENANCQALKHQERQQGQSLLYNGILFFTNLELPYFL